MKTILKVIMKNKIAKIMMFVLCVSIVFSCNKRKTIHDYNSNLEIVQSAIADINEYFLDDSKTSINISKYYTEDFIFYSYPAGHKKGVKTSKVDYIKNIDEMKKMNLSINIGHCIYLPGINELSYDLDGSVRVYYGATMAIDTKTIEFSGYQTINLKDGKIEGIWEWADYGGINNQLNQFYK
tara:strand:+ start:81 stop:626 length:546 start_codon:yes stop_codon:yes gene_type:complete